MRKIHTMIVALMAIAPMLCAWGGGSAYSRLYVKVSSEQVGMGKVYASDSSSVDASLFTETSSGNYAKEGENETITLYAHAQANLGCEFVGWSEEEGGDIVSEESVLAVDVPCGSKPNSGSSYTDRTRWANFKLTDYPAFQVTFAPISLAGAGGYTVDGVEVGVETVMLPDVATNHIYKVNLTSTANTGYEFIRWYVTDGVSTDYFSTEATTTYTTTNAVTIGAEFRRKNDVVVHFQPAVGEDGATYTFDGSTTVSDSVVDFTYEAADSQSVALALVGTYGKQQRWWYRPLGGEKTYLSYKASFSHVFEGEVDVGVDFSDEWPLAAKIGDASFYNIADAMEAWEPNTTLTLFADVTLEDAVHLTSADNRRIDLSTFTIGNLNNITLDVGVLAQNGNVIYLSLADAIGAAEAGDTISILEGTFAAGSDTITINKPITIAGQGKTATRLNFTAAAKCAFSITASNVTIENMTINQSATSEQTTHATINDVAYSDIVLRNLKLTGGKQSLAIKGVTNLTVDSCDFNQSSSAVLLYRAQGDTVFSNNTFALGSNADGAIFMTTVYGVDNGSAGTLTLRDNTMTSGKSFYYLEGAKSDMNLKLEIVGNVISGYSNKGIIFYTGSLGNYYESITITNNVFNKSGKYAIERVKEDSTLDIDARFNYWGSNPPNFNSLLRYVYNNNIKTEPYYRAYDSTLAPADGALSDLYPPVKIGEKFYASIAKALEAVQEGETIELLANLNENVDCSAFTNEFYLDYGTFGNTGTFTAAEGWKLLSVPGETAVYQYVRCGTITFSAGEDGPETVELPTDLVDYRPFPTNVVLALPIYDDDSKSFAGWKVADSDPAEIVSSIAADTAPSYNLVATWKAVQTIEIQTADGEELSAIKVSESWIEANDNLTSTSTAEEIRMEMEKTDENGLKKWENYVLGQDPSAAVKIDGEQAETTVMPVLNTLAPQTVDTGFTVTYSLDQVATNGEIVVEGAQQVTPEFEIDLSEVTSNAYYRMTATITATDGSGAEVHVVSTNTIGVLAVTNAPRNTIIPVPWASLADGEAISVSNLVRTATLAPGDRIQAYDATNGTYRIWTLSESKEWVPQTTVSGGGAAQAPSSDAYTIPRGSGVWLIRGEASADSPIYLVGGAADEAAKTELAAGTAESPSWNLVGNPTTEAVTVGGGSADGSVSPSDGDQILVPTAGGAPVNYTYDASRGQWYYNKTVPVYRTRNGVEVQVGVRSVREYVDAATVPAGSGFWYLNAGGESKDVQW